MTDKQRYYNDILDNKEIVTAFIVGSTIEKRAKIETDENSWEVDKEPSFQFKHYDYRVHKAVYCPYCRSDDDVLRAKEYDITDNVPVVKAYFCEDCEKTFYTTE